MNCYAISIIIIMTTITNTINTTSWQKNGWCTQKISQGFPRLLKLWILKPANNNSVFCVSQSEISDSDRQIVRE